MEWDEWNYFKAWNLYGPGADEILWRYAHSSGHLRYHLDRMGNVAFLLDLNGAVVEKYAYDVFGLPTVTDGNGENPRPYSWYGNRFMFTGREYFPELGLYDYRNRFYHPILGRFVQSDPIGFSAGDANLFRYCGGDPVNDSDPNGLVPGRVLKKPYEPKGSPYTVGSNYTPTGSHIPQSRTATWNGSSWNISYRDAVNGTVSMGSFVLVGGLGNGRGSGSADRGGVQFVSTSTPLGRALELGTRALDAIAKEPKVKEGLEGGGVFFLNGKMSKEFGTERMMTIQLLPGAIGTFHTHHLVGPAPYEFSDFDIFNYVNKRPDWVHLIGILDGPPGQFTIRAYIPEHGEGYYRSNPGHTPGSLGGG